MLRKESDIRRANERASRGIQICLLLVVLVGIVVFVCRQGGVPVEGHRTGYDRAYAGRDGGGREGDDGGRAWDGGGRMGDGGDRMGSYRSHVGEHGGGSYADMEDDADFGMEVESFPFDPNTADSTQLRRLGLTRFQIQNIYKYRAKGGAYHRPDEFKKLYGLTVQQWQHLKPLIRISTPYQYLADTPDAYTPDTYTPRKAPHSNNENGYQGTTTNGHQGTTTGGHQGTTTSGYQGTTTSGHQGTTTGGYQGTPEVNGTSPSYRGARRDTTLYPNKLKPGQTIEINQADTNALKRIPGIGGYYARKIVQYRERLGGFVSLQQLDDLENIPLGIEPYLTINPKILQKLRINHCTLRQLNSHPYLSYLQAKAIYEHVRTAGPIHSLQELSMHEEFTPQDLQRLAPYLDF